ncbi:DUF3021 domain-containing protein [Salicibibacter cibarius]|uniref:DUF3021 domain-containing protein n=1 Tax=Salicibibacter cibarius TaxID=2743000 RepID=A0A7T6Z1V2_9BACI|nr:DUF3021 domain-containing protein [Salicibibacter cibarius]QQK75450.1 DUF3021 domain-containing protein [Salicibibacter cibarius]
MKRFIEGLKTGAFIGVVMSLIFSGFLGQGGYYPMYPGSFMGEIYYEHLTSYQVTLIAVIIWGLIGLLFQFGKMIFTHTDLSLVAATILHFITMMIFMFILAVLAGWFPLKILGLTIYIIVFIIVYIIIWNITRRKYQQVVSGINEKLQK